jgi:hypothetical protein
MGEVQKIKPNAMQSLIADYFPHMWEDPDSPNGEGGDAEVAARAPLHGSKAFPEAAVGAVFDGGRPGARPAADIG